MSDRREPSRLRRDELDMSTSGVSVNVRRMAFLLAAMTVFGGLMVAVRPAAAPFQSLVVTPGLYGHPGLPRYPYLYTPNETVTFTVPAGLADGANYAISVYDPMYIENGFVGVRFARQFFAVQQYELRVEVDRRAYIGGDRVFVTWSANNLRDGTLATCPSQCFGQMW